MKEDLASGPFGIAVKQGTRTREQMISRIFEFEKKI